MQSHNSVDEDYIPSEDEVDDQEPEESHSKKKRPGVPHLIQKQLAQDIEDTGGITQFSDADGKAIRNWCNKNTALYGEIGDPIRRKIQNKVYKWSLLTEEKYRKKVLEKFKVQPLPYGQPTDQSKADHNITPRDPSVVNKHHTPSDQSKGTRKTVEASTHTKYLNKPTKPTKSIIKDSKTHTTMTDVKAQNKLGEKVVLPIPGGKYLVSLWYDTPLSANEELVVGDDALSVYRKSKEPRFDDGADFLSTHFPDWGSEDSHVVVSMMTEELKRLQPGAEEDDHWDNHPIVTLDQPVVKTFVDVKGNAIDEPYIQTVQGRTIVKFFLITKAAHEAKMKKPKYNFGNRANSQAQGRGPSGMNVGGSDDDSMMSNQSFNTKEEEMNMKIDTLAELVEQMAETNRQQEQQRQQQEQQRQQEHQKQRGEDMQAMFQELAKAQQEQNKQMMQGIFQMMQQAGGQMQQAGGPVPDPAHS